MAAEFLQSPYMMGAILGGGGYLLGSIPFGLVLTRLAGHGDIRDIGSGNIGATNVLRTGNKALALATLLLDSGKGAIAVLLISYLLFGHNTLMALMVGTGAIVGHCFPVWLGFKGGKGVATTLGTLLAAVPIAGLIACATWLLSAALFRISSLSALIAIALVPVSCFYFYGTLPATLALCIALLVFVRHKENIQRILKGEEPKIGAKKKNNEPVSANQ